VCLEPTATISLRSLDTLSSTFTALSHAVMLGSFDLIHFHAIPSGFFAPMARLRRIPIISTIQGLDWQRAKWKGLGSRVIKQGERSLVRLATRMIVVSRELKSYYRTQYDRTTSYLPNGVEVVRSSMYSDNSVLREFGLKSKEYFLYLARLVPEKRTQDLIQAFANVKTMKKLVIAGEAGYTNAYAASLKRMAATDNRVIFTGFQRGDAVHTLFHHANGYVLPSELEGLPLSLLEAMSHGTTPIVSDIGPHRELLESVPGYDLFFKPHDVAGLTDRLNRMLAQPEVYRDLGVRIQNFAETNFSWDAITRLTEELYFDALRGAPETAFDFPLGESS
jgi:glycosyltransferase involved in cell wall biosynthesis